MRWLLRILIIFFISIIFPFIPISLNNDFFTVIYTIIGIMFPLTLSQIMSFSFTEIENDTFVKRQRRQLTEIRNYSVILFSIATVSLLAKSISFNFQWMFIQFNIKFLVASYLIFTLAYFIVNFVALSTLKEQIDEEIRKAKNTKKRENELLDNT